MRILLIRQTSHYTHPLMGYGIGIIATLLDQAGHEVRVIDNNSIYRRYSDRALLRRIRRFAPQVVGHGITMPSAIHSYRLANKIRAHFPGIVQIAGGLHMKAAYEEALGNAIDVVCVREGEKVIVPLVEHLGARSGERVSDGLEGIDGIAYLDRERRVVHPVRFPIVESMDEVPIVNYRLFNLGDFIRHGNEPAVLPLVTQRGCPYKCTFCSDEFQRGDKRLGSARWLFANMKSLHEEYGAFYVAITDNNFALRKERVVEFCELMISSGLNERMRFSIQTKVESPMDDETLRLLKRAGLTLVGFGLERLDDYSQEQIQKKTPLERIHRVLASVQEAGLKISAYMLIGFPFETPEVLERERRLFDEITRYTGHISCSILQPIPGTPYYDDYPKAAGWYLNPEYHHIYRAHFAVVYEGYMEALADMNLFDLPAETVAEIKAVYDHFHRLAHGRYLTDRNLLTRTILLLDRLTARLSRLLFALSPDLEFWLFQKVRTLRYYLATRIYGRRVLKFKS